MLASSRVGFCIGVLLLCLLTWSSSRIATAGLTTGPTTRPAPDWNSWYAYKDATEMSRRLELVDVALSKNRSTPLEAQLLLELAQVYEEAGQTPAAEATLTKLAADDGPRILRISPTQTHLPGGTERLSRKLEAYYAANADFVADRALLALADLAHRQGQVDTEWNVLDRLRRKYPNGDRSHEDMQLLQELQKSNLVRDLLDPMRHYDRIFLRNRRPHLIGLIRQTVLVHNGYKLPVDARLNIDAQVVDTYGPLLTVSEGFDIATDGNNLLKEPPATTVAEATHMKETFQKLLLSANSIRESHFELHVDWSRRY